MLSIDCENKAMVYLHQHLRCGRRFCNLDFTDSARAATPIVSQAVLTLPVSLYATLSQMAVL